MHYNQHPSIVSNTLDSFVPLFDEDSNQTLVKTEKGIFEIIYNGENHPIKFTNLSDSSFITMRYDYMGRRGGKLYFNSQGTWTSTAKFFYKDYTLIEESTASNDILKEFVWDPTAGQATRPLYMKIPQGDINLFYLHDANKNVTEVTYFDTVNGIGAHYEYGTFGNTIATSRNVASTPNIITENPFRFSSEYHDGELDLIYYNYRHYNPEIGRWISRDPIEEQGGNNLYAIVKNNILNQTDYLGRECAKTLTIPGIMSRMITGHLSNETKITYPCFLCVRTVIYKCTYTFLYTALELYNAPIDKDATQFGYVIPPLDHKIDPTQIVIDNIKELPGKVEKEFCIPFIL